MSESALERELTAHLELHEAVCRVEEEDAPPPEGTDGEKED